MNVSELIGALSICDPDDEVCIYIMDTGERRPIEIEQIDFLVRNTVDINLVVRDI